MREEMRRAKYVSIPAGYRRAVIHPSRSRGDAVRGVVSETWDRLVEIYSSFVAWSSAYADENVDYLQEPKQRRETVHRCLREFSDYYAPRAVWLDLRTCNAIEEFIETSEGLYSEFVDEIRDRGYSRRVKANMAARVSAELGPLKREAVSNLQAELRES